MPEQQPQAKKILAFAKENGARSEDLGIDLPSCAFPEHRGILL
jgi:hypothetical protein